MEGSTLRGRKNPMKPAVSWHTILLARSSVLYLLRPLLPERGCCLTEQTISGDSRTGGFQVPPGREMCGFAQAKSGCLGVGDAAQRREFSEKFL